MKFKLSLLALISIVTFSSCSNIKGFIFTQRFCPEERKVYINKKTNKGSCNPIGYEEESITYYNTNLLPKNS